MTDGYLELKLSWELYRRGPESLAEHRKLIEGPDSPVPDSLVRLSVGLENVNDLIAVLHA